DGLWGDIVGDLRRIREGADQTVGHGHPFHRNRFGPQRRVTYWRDAYVIAPHHGEHADLHLRTVTDECAVVDPCFDPDVVRFQCQILHLANVDAGNSYWVSRADRRRVVG